VIAFLRAKDLSSAAVSYRESPSTIVSKALCADLFSILPEDHVGCRPRRGENMCAGWNLCKGKNSTASAWYVLHRKDVRRRWHSSQNLEELKLGHRKPMQIVWGSTAI
jgi:hypothetical protein